MAQITRGRTASAGAQSDVQQAGYEGLMTRLNDIVKVKRSSWSVKSPEGLGSTTKVNP